MAKPRPVLNSKASSARPIWVPSCQGSGSRMLNLPPRTIAELNKSDALASLSIPHLYIPVSWPGTSNSASLVDGGGGREIGSRVATSIGGRAGAIAGGGRFFAKAEL